MYIYSVFCILRACHEHRIATVCIAPCTQSRNSVIVVYLHVVKASLVCVRRKRGILRRAESRTTAVGQSRHQPAHRLMHKTYRCH